MNILLSIAAYLIVVPIALAIGIGISIVIIRYVSDVMDKH